MLLNQRSTSNESISSPKIGVLLTNLGTPDAPTKAAVKPYLKEFLSDPRVIESPPPRWLWLLILNGIILNIRPKKSAKKYQSVWNTHGEGSPLLVISKKQKSAVEAALNKNHQVSLLSLLVCAMGIPLLDLH